MTQESVLGGWSGRVSDEVTIKLRPRGQQGPCGHRVSIKNELGKLEESQCGSTEQARGRVIEEVSRGLGTAGPRSKV